MSRLQFRPALPWAALAALAFSLRLAAVLALQSYHAPFTYEHGEIAKNLLAGRGFSVEFLGQNGPTSQQAPMYPAMLAGAYKLLGIESRQAFLAMQILQCLAGAATVLCVVWITRSLVNRNSGNETLGWMPWLAGAGAAVYPSHVYMATHIQVVPWATLLLTLLFAVCVSPRWAGATSGAIVAGAITGLMLLFEPILALAAPIAALAFVLFGHNRQRITRLLTASVLMAAVAWLIVAPWLWRNARVHGEFVFVKSSFGYAFWQGNNPQSYGTDKIPKASAAAIIKQRERGVAGWDQALWDARRETLYIDDVLLKPYGYGEFAGLSEPQRSRRLGREAWQWIQANPDLYAKLCLARLKYFLLFDETNPKTQHPLYRISTVAWLVLLGAGLWASRRTWRRMWPTWAVFAAVGLFHVLTIVSARFRMPLEPLTFPAVACGALWLCQAARMAIQHVLRAASLAR